MNEADIEDLEKRLKAIRTREPSEGFFAAVEDAMKDAPPSDEEIADVEQRLKSLTPVAPSEKFFAKVASEMDERERGVSVPFSRRKPSVLMWHFAQAVSAVAAVVLLAAGVFLWNKEQSVPTADTMQIALDIEDNSVRESADAAIDLLVARETSDHAPHYELISSEESVCGVEEMPIVEEQDGSIVRPVRYICTSTRRWKDPKTEKICVEHLPFEEVVPTVLAVY